MTFIDLAKKRRSVRAYKAEQVSRQDIEKIIEAGIWAPSAFNAQVLKYFVLQDAEKISAVSAEIIDQRLKTNRQTFKPRPVKDPVFYSAPTVVFICTEKPKTDYAEIDAQYFAQNCFLEATEMGLGTCTIGATKLLENVPEIKKAIGIPEDWEILLSFCLGYPEGESHIPERKNPEIIYEG